MSFSNMRCIVTGLGLKGLLGLTILGSTGCGGPPESRHTPKPDDVPANSMSEARLKGDDKPKSTPPPSDPPPSPQSDPTQPETTKLEETSTGPNGKPLPPPSKKGPKVGKGECNKAFDKYLELELVSRGMPADPALIKQAREMGAQKNGEAPCDATKSQYDCAMAAKTPAQWQTCMK